MENLLKTFEEWVGLVGAFAWGPPMLIFLVGTGFWLTLALRGLQFRKLWYSLYLALIKRKEDTDEPGDISNFQALMHAQMEHDQNLEKLIVSLNERVLMNAKGEKFITAFICIYNHQTRELTYVNAGHQPALSAPTSGFATLPRCQARSGVAPDWYWT